MAVLIPDLCLDLVAESAVLESVLELLGQAGWQTPTPADGWSIQDQISHLAYFDHAVTTAVTDPDRFRVELAETRKLPGNSIDAIVTAGRSHSGGQILEQFRAARSTMIEAFEHADLSVRVPWYGPAMSVASALTARIMETWAHGQDVFDALDVAHPPTVALRQVAHIGVRALPNSFTSHGRPVPLDEVRLELTGPDGDQWIWGPEPDRTDNLITGPSLDFCLIVTQRRHVDDTDIVMSGPVATEWMSIAQAFAGPAGSGRRPGQFPKG
ncbi:MAG: TIGR03084 family metal-binding protein [Ilumatobacteraceae bacterium]